MVEIFFWWVMGFVSCGLLGFGGSLAGIAVVLGCYVSVRCDDG